MTSRYLQNVVALFVGAVLLCMATGSTRAATGPAFTLNNVAATVFPATSAGQTSAAQTIQLTTTRAVAIASIGIPMSVNGHQEFAVGTVTGCATDGVTQTATGTTCSISVTFAPTYAGTRLQTLAVTDSTGTVFSVGLSGLSNGPQALLTPGSVATTGGVSGGYYFSGDGGAVASARFSAPWNIAVDASNNVYIADEVSGNVRVIYQAGAALACLIEVEEPTLFGLPVGSTSCAGATSAPVAGDVYTIGGDPTPYSTTVTSHVKGSDDNRIATAITSTTSTLNSPAGIAVDAYGNVVIGDYNAYKVRVIYAGGASMACLIEIEEPTLFGLSSGATSCAGATSSPVPGYIYTLAGTGSPGATGDGSKAISATMTYAAAIGLSSAGDIFLADNSTQSARTSRLRVIYNGGATAASLITAENPTVAAPVVGNIYKIAGGVFASTGDGGLASSGGLLYCRGLVLDSDGNIVFTDTSTTSGSLTAKVRVVYAGGTRMASLISMENAGVTPQLGYLYTIGGSSSTGYSGDGGLATSAKMTTAYSLTVDPAGDVYVSDYGNYVLRKINSNDGKMTTFAGNNTQGVVSGSALAAELWDPYGMAFGSSGTLFFTDPGVYRIRNVSLSAASITFSVAAPVGNNSETEYVYENNVGNQPMTISAITASTNFAVVPSGSTLYSDCVASMVLQPGQTCVIGVVMAPTTGGTLTGTLTVTDNSLGIGGNSQSVSLTGTSAIQTSTVLNSSNANADLGANLTFSAVVSVVAGQNTTGAAALAGNVTFKDGTTTLGVVAIDANGNAQYSTSALTAATHTITAAFVPTVSGYASSSGKLTEVVTAPAFNATTSVLSIAVTTGNTATVAFSVISMGGYTGTVSASCGSLPAKVSCSFSPSSATFTGQDNTVAVTMTIGTTGATAAVTPHTVWPQREIAVAGLMGALLFAVRRRRKIKTVLMTFCALALLTGISGCGNGTQTTAAPGVFNVNAVFNDGTTTVTIPVTVSVLGAGWQQ